jgi:uncharacterized protein YndB with AHSA1/START domain
MGTLDAEPLGPIEPIELMAYTRADPGAAWAALTEPAVVAEWFTDASPVGPVGSPYRLDFGDGSVVEGVIVALEPGTRFAHTWAWAGDAGSGSTLVSWAIAAEPGGGSRITLVHAGWSEAGADVATREDHRGYWEMYLSDLVILLDGV